MYLARAANGYFDAKQPWKQRKEDRAACGTTINVCVQTVKGLATLMAPFLPFSAAQTAEMLEIEPGPEGILPWAEATCELPAGHELGEPVILFKKLDAAEVFGDPA
jgi:methionyl-tRNA synthetase